MDVTQALRACPIFKDFTDTGLSIMAGICNERSFPVGTPLFVENMVADAMLIIVDGKVKVTSKGKSNDDVTLGELGPGDVLGELSLMQQGQRMCTASATQKVRALEMRSSDFARLLSQKPQACVKLLMGIVKYFGQQVADNRDALKSLLPKG